MDAKKFGAFVAKKRKEKGMTQAELGAKLNVTDKAVSRWERGLGYPDIMMLAPLADTLDLSNMEVMRAVETRYDDVVNHGVYVTRRFFDGAIAYVKEKALTNLPEAMQEQQKDGRSLYTVLLPSNGKVLLSTAQDNEENTAYVDAKDVVIGMSLAQKTEDEKALIYLPNSFIQFMKDGGTVYMECPSEQGTIRVYKDRSLTGESTKCEYRIIKDYRHMGYAELASAMKRIVEAIRRKTLPMADRIVAGRMLRTYLNYCIEQEDLSDLTSAYRDATDSELIIGYNPPAVAKFVGRMCNRYPRVTIHEKLEAHLDRIFTEITGILCDCVETINEADDGGLGIIPEREEEAFDADRILCEYLDLCLGFEELDDLTAIYSGTYTDDKGYDTDAGLEFVMKMKEKFLPNE